MTEKAVYFASFIAVRSRPQLTRQEGSGGGLLYGKVGYARCLVKGVHDVNPLILAIKVTFKLHSRKNALISVLGSISAGLMSPVY